MELSKSFEFLGTWWLSSNPEDKFRGVLKLAPNGILLKLDGKRNSLCHLLNYSSNKMGLMNGKLAHGEKVTLTNGFASNGGSGDGIDTQEIIANLCLIGGHFGSDEDIKFDSLTVYLSSFENWLQYSPFKFKPLPKYSKKIVNKVSCESIETLFDIEVPSLMGKIKTSHNLSFKRDFSYTNVDWTHTPGISIETNSLIDKKNLWEMAYSVEQLFSLLMGHPVSVRRIDCFNKDYPKDGSNLFEVYIPLFEKANFDSGKYHPGDVIVSFPQAKRKLKKVFDIWFSQKTEERPIRNLFHNQFSEINKKTLSHFLNYMQALEIYARINFNQPLIPKSKFINIRDKLISVIPSNCSIEQRLEVEGRINNMNYPSLRQRLGNLMGKLPKEVQEVFGFKEEYIGTLVRTRNYFTHYSSNDKSIFSEDDLWVATDKLECLLIVVQLKSLGFDPVEVVKKLKRNWKYFYVLKG